MSISNSITFIEKVKNNEKFFCVICDYILNSKEDFESAETFKCCHNCFLTFVEARKSEWKEGWRPSKSRIKEYIINKDINFKNKIEVL